MPEHAPRQATRAFWSGTITFGLVSIPVDLFAAVQPRQISMKMVDAEGQPLGRRYFCPKDGKELEGDEIVRGYETERGKMVVITEEELESVAPEMTRDIELRRFVPRAEIPAAHYKRPYFLAPSGSAKAYHLLAAVLEESEQVGIGTFVMRGHQHLVGILPENGVLRAHTLRFAQELRSPKAVGLGKAKKAPPKQVKEFATALKQLSEDKLDPDEMWDWYAGELQKLAEKKKKKREDVVKVAEAESEEAEEGAEVIDLMKVLRDRLTSAKATKKAPARRRSEGKKRATR